MDSLIQDIRYGLRGLLRTPGFTLTALLALALGIGANSAIFSVVNPVLFKPLPFPDPERLVAVVPYHQKTGEEGNASYLGFSDWRDQARSFERMAAFHPGSVAVGAPLEPVRTKAMFTTSGLFSVLGARALLGRTLEESDDAPAAPPVAVLSHGLWARHFRSDPRVIGSDTQIDGKSFTVVGVLPEAFRFPGSQGRGVGVWAPLKTDSHPEFLEQRGHHHLLALGRLKKGITLEHASSEMAAIAARINQEHERDDIQSRVKLVGLHARSAQQLRPIALVLSAAVGLVLLIACANVANLLLARSNARQREFAIRLSLGASRRRLLQQLLTESVLLSLLGAGIGLLLSLWMTDALKALLGSRIEDVQVDGAVLAFTAGVAVVTGIAFGLAPAASGSRAALHEALKEAGVRASLSKGRRRLQNLLIASQLALAFALLASAGLMIKSLVNLTRVEPGFEPANLLTLRLPLPEWSYTADRKRELYRRLFETAKALPGVVSAGGGDPFPFYDSRSRSSITIAGRPPPPPGEGLHPHMYEVSPDYFQAMGIPLLEGRTFSEEERAAERAIIINQKLAKRFWPGESPLGRRIIRGMGRHDDAGLEIVGVVGDVRHGALDSEAPLQFYLPYEHSPWMDLTMVVRTQGSPEALFPALRKLVREADPSLPILEPELATELVEQTTTSRRVTMLLLGAFALLALLLATFGLYGLVTYSVGQRNRELAIRVALGAQRGDVVRLVMNQGLKVTALGLGAGLLLALGAARLLSSLLYGVAPSDPVTYAAIALVLGCAAMGASYVPARRATRVSPLVVLRSE